MVDADYLSLPDDTTVEQRLDLIRAIDGKPDCQVVWMETDDGLSYEEAIECINDAEALDPGTMRVAVRYHEIDADETFVAACIAETACSGAYEMALATRLDELAAHPRVVCPVCSTDMPGTVARAHSGVCPACGASLAPDSEHDLVESLRRASCAATDAAELAREHACARAASGWLIRRVRA